MEDSEAGIESDQVQAKREHTHLESRGPHVARLAGLQIPGGGLQAGLAQDVASGRGGSIRMSGFQSQIYLCLLELWQVTQPPSASVSSSLKWGY